MGTYVVIDFRELFDELGINYKGELTLEQVRAIKQAKETIKEQEEFVQKVKEILNESNNPTRI